MVNLNCSNCWPIAGYTWILMEKDYKGNCKYELMELVKFLSWTFTDPTAKTLANQHGFVPLANTHIGILIPSSPSLLSLFNTLVINCSLQMTP